MGEQKKISYIEINGVRIGMGTPVVTFKPKPAEEQTPLHYEVSITVPLNVTRKQLCEGLEIDPVTLQRIGKN